MLSVQGPGSGRSRHMAGVETSCNGMMVIFIIMRVLIISRHRLCPRYGLRPPPLHEDVVLGLQVPHPGPQLLELGTFTGGPCS